MSIFLPGGALKRWHWSGTKSCGNRGSLILTLHSMWEASPQGLEKKHRNDLFKEAQIVCLNKLDPIDLVLINTLIKQTKRGNAELLSSECLFYNTLKI